MEIRVGPPTVTIHADEEFAVSEVNAEMSRSKEQGYFVADTRLVSGYRLKLGGTPAWCCDSSALHHRSARYEFTNPAIISADGREIPARCLHLRLDRSIGRGLHEDYDLTNYSGGRIMVDLEMSIESDFADLFDVRNHRLVRRGVIQSDWDLGEGRLVTRYRNGDFARGVMLQVARAGSMPQYANGAIQFQVTLEPGHTWHTCLLWRPILGEQEAQPAPSICHDVAGNSEADRARTEWTRRVTAYTASDPAVTQALRQAVDDLAGMRMHRHDVADTNLRPDNSSDGWVPAAGVPWFVTLFGRDVLTVSFQTLLLSPDIAMGSLRALGGLLGEAYDDDRDMQPGKVEHEIRHGELAALKLIPHTPYYGTHEATSLYVLVAAHAWRWTGDRDALDAVRPYVERALTWLDTDGDMDGDGLQEYRTRSGRGYYNQGWKDAEDAIVDADGRPAKLPIALCEHQAIAAAAKSAWADVLEQVYGETGAAARLRSESERLVEALESRFWWPEQGIYYLGLDGDKQPIASVSSNPGQVLWTGVVDADRARQTAARLLAPDMWSGWGIRTLSADHPAFNPLSYQLGSVWPHDNAIAAAGLRTYGLDAEASQVARALFDAAACFAGRRLPELFGGLDRDPGGFPVQYLGANVPQAWASGAVIHMMSTLLGAEPDAAAGCLTLRPALPEWLDELRLERLQVGDASVDIVVRRRDDASHALDVEHRSGKLEVRLLEGLDPQAPKRPLRPMGVLL